MIHILSNGRPKETTPQSLSMYSRAQHSLHCLSLVQRLKPLLPVRNITAEPPKVCPETQFIYVLEVFVSGLEIGIHLLDKLVYRLDSRMSILHKSIY